MAAADASPDVDKLSTSFQQIKLNQAKDGYLFLSNKPFPGAPSLSEVNYVIYLPPMNSSGDIYHIIAYLMLSKYENKELPAVQLSYGGRATSESQEPKMNTYSQTQRCIQFAKHLGFEDQFLSPIAFDEGGYRQNARFTKMFNHLKEQHNQEKSTRYIEQKLLTTLISYYFVKYGRDHTVKILNESYAKWFDSEKINQTIGKSVEQRIQSMPTRKPLIILQYRFSSKANENQNISEIEILIRLEEYLKSKGYVIWYLFVDSRLKKPSIIGQIKNKTNCFPHQIDSIDYGKLFHLEFLLQLFKIKNLIGIIGNTSGCLDLAAFIGHNVLNLHQFHSKFNYQSYRIFLQSSFLIVEYFEEDAIKKALLDRRRNWTNFSDKIINENIPIAGKWINRTPNTPTFPDKLLASVQKVQVDKKGFIDLHQIINWQDGKPEKTSIPIFKELKEKLCDKIQKSAL